MSRFSVFITGTALLALVGCQHLPLRDLLGLDDDRSEPPARQEERDQRELERMKEDIYALVGDAPCEEPGDCHYIGLGAKPCGGPWEYVIYSSAYTDPDQLRAHVEEYNDFEREMNRRYGYASDCSIAAPPEVGCLEGYCVDLNDGSFRPPEPIDELLEVRFIDSFQQLPRSDLYDLGGLAIDGHILAVDVAYSGGCREHEFQLWATQAVTKSIPPQQTLRLTHDANGDACEAYLQETRHFDLTPLRDLHQGQEEVVLIIGDRRVVFEP